MSELKIEDKEGLNFLNEMFNNDLNNNNSKTNDDNSKSNDNLIGVNDIFESERSEYTKILNGFSDRFKDIKNLPLLQVDLYSFRQKLVEYYSYLNSVLINVNNFYFEMYKKRNEYYTNSFSLKLKDDIKDKYINLDIKEVYTKKELLQNHISFIKECISTIDKMIFGIKIRVDIENIIKI